MNIVGLTDLFVRADDQSHAHPERGLALQRGRPAVFETGASGELEGGGGCFSITRLNSRTLTHQHTIHDCRGRDQEWAESRRSPGLALVALLFRPTSPPTKCR